MWYSIVTLIETSEEVVHEKANQL